MLKKSITKLGVIISVLALAAVLGGCAANTQNQQPDNPTLNRQYMAQLNQKISKLSEVTTKFQEAVAQKDAVLMNAQVKEIDGIISDIENAEVTDDLKDVSSEYVDGLKAMSASLKSYADAYTRFQSGELDAAGLKSQIDDAQKAYDDAASKLKGADDAVKKISGE